MHKRLPKELVFLIATLRCHTGSLKEEARGLQGHNFAGIFFLKEIFPFTWGVLEKKMQQQWKKPWCEDWLVWVPAWEPGIWGIPRGRFAAEAQLSSLGQLQRVLSLPTAAFQSGAKYPVLLEENSIKISAETKSREQPYGFCAWKGPLI